ncbi:MAG: superoxide dismutase family protein [Pseudomonadota bacterium]
MKRPHTRLMIVSARHLKAMAALASAAFLTACGDASDGGSAVRPMLSNLAPASATADAAGSFVGVDGAARGAVVFVEGPRGMIMRIDVNGLSQGWHAIHLHQVGDCSDGAGGFKASKSHINPDQNAHGLLNPAGDERADIPNIYAGPDGRATAEIYRVGVGLSASEAGAAADVHPILDNDGFAVIIHENPDDHVTQPIGGAGARVACAAITG